MSQNLVMAEERKKGPVEILCKEIDFPFQRALENPDLFLAFIKVLVSEVDHLRWITDAVAPMTDKPASAASSVALEKVRAMLECPDIPERDRLCAELHSFIDETGIDEAYPCDHLLDMLNSCVSAVRFGLEIPCRSRHAAEAAGHVWERRYGITCQDSHTSRWKKDWARAKFQDALTLAWMQSAKPKSSQ